MSTSLPNQAREDVELIADILGARNTRDADPAYAALLKRYWKVVIALLRSRVASAQDADDLAQETFVRAFRSLPKLENHRLFVGWLLRIARNLATDHLRRRRPTTSLESFDGAPPGIVGESQSDERMLDRLAHEEEVAMALRAIGELPEKYQTVVTLRYLQGLTGREIAEQLGEPDGTVRNRLFRALARLRTILEQKPGKKRPVCRPQRGGTP